MEIVAQKVSKLSLLKLIFTGFFCSVSCMAILFGIASIFGVEGITWNGEVKTGFEGMFYAMLMIPLFSFTMTLGMGFFLIYGLWIYSFFGPLKLKFKDVVESKSNV